MWYWFEMCSLPTKKALWIKLINTMKLLSSECHRTLLVISQHCCQVASHYLNQCWTSFMKPYGMNRPVLTQVHISTCCHLGHNELTCWYQVLPSEHLLSYNVGFSDCDKQRVLMHGHQGWNVRHGLCHIYMIYVYIWVVYSPLFFVVCSLL